MSTTVNLAGTSYSIPSEGDSSYATDLTAFFIQLATSTKVLQVTSSSFPLSQDLSFGNSYGLKVASVKSQATNPSSTGIVRLGNAESIGWRNASNNADYLLKVNASNQLEFNGTVLASSSGASFQDSTFSLFDNSDTTKLLAFQLSGITTGTTRTLTVPDASTTLVGTDATQTLTNKTLTAPIISTISNTGTVTLPTATDTLVGRATTDTLTNKTIDAASNTISNVGNANISAAAAIARSKLATLTASRAMVTDGSGNDSVATTTAIEIGYVNGVTSAIQTQLDAKVPKTLTTTTGDMIYASSANTPARLPIGSSGQVIKSVGGIPTWATFSGGINYLSSNPDAEADTSGWATYADAAATIPVDGTGGSPSSTWTRSTSSPLRGTASFLWTKSAANRQGEGVSYDFTIDAADKAKVLQISFDYFVSSGTYASSDLIVYIYDVTNATLIQPAGYTIQNASVQMKQIATFQTASNSTSYRLIIHTSSTSASAYTVQFDNFNVGPQNVTNGAAITDPVAYTPTFTGLGTVVSINAYSRRNGNMLEFWGTATTGTPTATEARISLGFNGSNSNVTTDSTLPTLSAIGILARGAVAALSYMTLTEASKTYVTFGKQDASAFMLTKQNGNALLGVGEVFSWKGEVPITGWSSNTQMSNDTDTRVVAMRAPKTTSNHTSSGSWADVGTWDTASLDTHGAFTTSTGQYLVPVSGNYLISGNLAFAANATGIRGIRVYKNGTTAFGGGEALATASAEVNMPFSAIVPVVAGDNLRIQAFQNSGGNLNYSTNGYNTLSIQRLSGPATIAASESVNARYTNTAGTTLTKSAANTVPYATKDFDSHSAFATDTYTVPIAGKYLVIANVTLAGSYTWAAADYLEADVYKNGSIHTGTFYEFTGATSGNSSVTVQGLVNCVAGDTIKINVNPSKAAAGNVTLNTSAGYNSLSITRVGN